jgi:hypothetical protein
MSADPVTEFETYRQELLGLLGNRDPVGVLQASLDEVARMVDQVSPEQLERRPAAGEWSPREVLSHLADSDLVHAVRVRMIVTQDQPTLVGYDQEAWTARFGGLDPDALATVERWKSLRLANLRLYASLSAAEWERVGLHTERGPESVRLHVQLLAGHDRAHLDQIRRGLSR